MSEMCCPHCAGALTLKQAIEILNGSGYQRIYGYVLQSQR
jgi:hypothetical protein